MDFRIADTFTDSLVRLTNEEQKLVKTTAFDLQMDPVNPGMSLHKLDRARDRNFWSVRVGRDIRMIVHRTEASFLLCYVDHHDPAYRWAERRKLETHPWTGAAQWVEIRERIDEPRPDKPQQDEPRQDRAAPDGPMRSPVSADSAEPAAPQSSAGPGRQVLFADRSDEELLAYGIPADWLDDIRAADEDRLLLLVDHLPAEAAEALLELATGGTPALPAVSAPGEDPFRHPDAQRRFRVMNDVDELERALSWPWDKWLLFLHPSQRQWVERSYAGPARISGSAGTGKTIVALHRAEHLARTREESRVLLTTVSEPLANALRAKLWRLVSNRPALAERLEVHALETVARRLYEARFGPVHVATREQIRDALSASGAVALRPRVALSFLLDEWDDVVDAWQVPDWPQYRDFRRLGRKIRLSESRRVALWKIFETTREHLRGQGLSTWGAIYERLAEDERARLASGSPPTFDHVVVDESQDVGPAPMRWLAALAGGRADGLFFAGDLGQRIFQTPFSWKAAGVEIRGRARTLKINYRTSHQIRSQADRLLGVEIADVDGLVEDRSGTVSVFNGQPPTIRLFADEAAEVADVCDWLRARLADGLPPHEIGLFVRSEAELDRARRAAHSASLPFRELTDLVETVSGCAAIGTMHLAKGLEFRAVVVMACDDEVLPLSQRVESVGDESDLEEVYHTERHLLYVAATRARDFLLVSGVAPGSEFLADLNLRTSR